MISNRRGNSRTTRRVAVAIVAAAATFVFSALAQAQNYPTKPVRFIIGQAPGGSTDSIGRAVAQRLSEMWGQPVIVENKPGAGTIIAAEFVARAPADGYTIWVTGDVGLTLNPFMYSKLPYDPRKDFALITRLLNVHQLLVVPASLPANTIKEFVDLMKKDELKMNYGSPGLGDPGHINMEWFKTVAGFDMVHVPYRGLAPALTAILSGDLHAVIASILASEQHVKTGKMKPIVMSGPARAKMYPNLQTLTEAGYPTVSFANFLALVAPAGTSPDILNKIAADTRKILYDPEFRAKMIDPFDYELIGDTPEQFAEAYKAELIVSEKRVKASGAKLD